MSALEVATLDWRRADLVMLSACESALGEQTRGEGLLGLQRAFQVGGANSVVATLWPVEQKATMELTQLFYENLWKLKLPKLEALRQAQLAVLNQTMPSSANKGGVVVPLQGDVTVARTRPAVWAGWSLSGDPGNLPELVKAVNQGTSQHDANRITKNNLGTTQPNRLKAWPWVLVCGVVIIGGIVWRMRTPPRWLGTP